MARRVGCQGLAMEVERHGNGVGLIQRNYVYINFERRQLVFFEKLPVSLYIFR